MDNSYQSWILTSHRLQNVFLHCTILVGFYVTSMHSYDNYNSKTVPWFSHIHKEGLTSCVLFYDKTWLLLLPLKSFHGRIEKNICPRVLLQNKIKALVCVHIIKLIVLAHYWFNSYASELVPIFYSAIKHRYKYFIS